MFSISCKIVIHLQVDNRTPISRSDTLRQYRVSALRVIIKKNIHVHAVMLDWVQHLAHMCFVISTCFFSRIIIGWQSVFYRCFWKCNFCGRDESTYAKLYTITAYHVPSYDWRACNHDISGGAELMRFSRQLDHWCWLYKIPLPALHTSPPCNSIESSRCTGMLTIIRSIIFPNHSCNCVCLPQISALWVFQLLRWLTRRYLATLVNENLTMMEKSQLLFFVFLFCTSILRKLFFSYKDRQSVYKQHDTLMFLCRSTMQQI